MDTNELNSNTIKFHTCKYKSEEQIEKLVKRCSCQGGDIKLKGFFCHKRQLFQITPSVCHECQEYESK